MNHMMAAYALVMLRKGAKIAMVLRGPTMKFGANLYGLIGGAVEEGENFRQAAVREVFEEAGVSINANDLQFKHMFYRHGTEHALVACIFVCDVWQGEAYNKEPEKHAALTWFLLDELPHNILPAHGGALRLITQGVAYSEQAPG
ncbi:NUDIX domain-containing protein [Candidatus Dependentiae bacterium]|nr:NUDIX domain-containing protein [Candidatus Dependentiae bacterium]